MDEVGVAFAFLCLVFLVGLTVVGFSVALDPWFRAAERKAGVDEIRKEDQRVGSVAKAEAPVFAPDETIRVCLRVSGAEELKGAYAWFERVDPIGMFPRFIKLTSTDAPVDGLVHLQSEAGGKKRRGEYKMVRFGLVGADDKEVLPEGVAEVRFRVEQRRAAPPQVTGWSVGDTEAPSEGQEKQEDLLLPPVPTAAERAPCARDDKEE